MIDFDKAHIIGRDNRQVVIAEMISEFLVGHFQFGAFEHPTYDEFGNSLLHVLAATKGRITQEGIDSGEHAVADVIFGRDSDEEMGMYSILPGVELQFIHSYSSLDRPRGFSRHLGPGVLLEIPTGIDTNEN